ALRVDLADTVARVDEEHVAVLIHDDAGCRVSEGSAGEQSTKSRSSQNYADPETTHNRTSPPEPCSARIPDCGGLAAGSRGKLRCGSQPYTGKEARGAAPPSSSRQLWQLSCFQRCDFSPCLQDPGKR